MSEIMSISRMRLGTDGEGITTLVAFYGCHLQCKYCLNQICHRTIIWEDVDFTPDELYDVLKVDDIYFRMSGGGVTFGGGEPLLNYEFIKEFVKIVPKSWKISIETSLNVPWENIRELVGRVDKWIIDVKDMNPQIYKEYTGLDNTLVKENLSRLREIRGDGVLHLRFPRIPGYNTDRDISKSLNEVKKYRCKKEQFTYVYKNNEYMEESDDE